MSKKSVRWLWFLSLGVIGGLICIIVYFLPFFAQAFDYYLPNKNRELLCAQLSTMVEDHENGITPYVDLADINSFSWERVHIFLPDSEPEWIDDDLGMYWPVSRWTGIDYSENIILIVFTEHGKVVQYCDFHNEWSGFYRNLYEEDGYDYDDARFVIDEKYELRHLLKWVPKP